MQAGRLLTSTLSILAFCAGGSIVLAQGTGPWVDPPAENSAGSPPPAPQTQPLRLPPVSPMPEPRQPEQPVKPARPPQIASPPAQPEPQSKAAESQPKPLNEQHLSRSETAKNFAIDYLQSWSSRNDVALHATAELYAPRVLYHGRTISLERLYKEKQRFIRRWPEREYRPRKDAIGIQCNPNGAVCAVHTVFDYTAASPKRRRISQGSGALQLIVEFIGEKPVIVAEHSTLLTQTRSRTLASEGTSNE